MGLCKCPKRRVTNQFCFEHRVNVCEHCMVTNHPKCIVQSYLQWLQDSDYNPICELCMKDLSAEECIRLACYHVYHWSCLDRVARDLPSTTAPAGYTCPSCRSPLFPAANLVSPVADVLREKLAGVNWARAGLGLPLLSEEREQKPSEARFDTAVPVGGQARSTPPLPLPPAQQQQQTASHSVLMLDEQQVTYNRAENSRRAYQDAAQARRALVDHDEDKYKRRPATELLRRWWSNMSGVQRGRAGGGGGLVRRYLMTALLIVASLVLLALVFSRLGHFATDNDPMLDPLNNPLIKIEPKPVKQLD